jgi:hypothetical protein
MLIKCGLPASQLDVQSILRTQIVQTQPTKKIVKIEQGDVRTLGVENKLPPMSCVYCMIFAPVQNAGMQQRRNV